jgi:NAD(P)-dependent dehydrogenase (short-subunit alcohol dehydrogenase family)
MKISITGHSKGIGKACYDVLSKDHDVIGFSRSNGFNISEPKKIFSASVGCDVFINNAYIMDTDDQIKLFKIFFKEWKDDENKFIVNIGSKSKYYPYNPNMPNLTANFRSGKGYNDNKTDLAEVVYDKQLFTAKKCRITTINPGYTNTDLVARLVNEVNMLSPQEVANTVKWVIEQPKHIEVGDLGIWHPSER